MGRGAGASAFGFGASLDSPLRGHSLSDVAFSSQDSQYVLRGKWLNLKRLRLQKCCKMPWLCNILLIEIQEIGA
jgi:hypothetical protein